MISVMDHKLQNGGVLLTSQLLALVGILAALYVVCFRGRCTWFTLLF